MWSLDAEIKMAICSPNSALCCKNRTFLPFFFPQQSIRRKMKMLKVMCEEEREKWAGVRLRNQMRSGNTLSGLQIKCQQSFPRAPWRPQWLEYLVRLQAKHTFWQCAPSRHASESQQCWWWRWRQWLQEPTFWSSSDLLRTVLRISFSIHSNPLRMAWGISPSPERGKTCPRAGLWPVSDPREPGASH